MQGEFRRLVGTVEPRFGEVPRDWGNCFVISGARYNKFVKKTKKQRKNKHYNNQTKQNKRNNPKFRHIGANVYLKIGLLRDGDDEVNF